MGLKVIILVVYFIDLVSGYYWWPPQNNILNDNQILNVNNEYNNDPFLWSKAYNNLSNPMITSDNEIYVFNINKLNNHQTLLKLNSKYICNIQYILYNKYIYVCTYMCLII